MALSSQIDITVLIVTHGRTQLLLRSIGSLLEAALTTPQLSIEFLIGINGKDVLTEQCLIPFQENPRFKIITFKNKETPAKARNLLLPEIRGAWTYFIDDDAFVDQDFFIRLLTAIALKPGASIFGGPNLTPPDSSLFQKATGRVLGSRLAAYLSSARYVAKGGLRASNEEELILCNLFVRTEELGSEPFPRDFVCCEENWFLQTAQEKNSGIIYSPDLWVWHERRDGLLSLASQVFRYGCGRGQNIRARPSTFRWPHVFPSLCVIYALTCLFFLLRGVDLNSVFFLPFVIYSLLCVGVGLSFFKKPDSQTMRIASLGALLFPVIHSFYGLGVIKGVLQKNENRFF